MLEFILVLSLSGNTLLEISKPFPDEVSCETAGKRFENSMVKGGYYTYGCLPIPKAKS